ncbi:TlpA disulfide reductase family protein [Deinococcus sp. QL22]|uniref:TlpA family protein disulfide reductase n=1 Tax=Deinococcus sp. QL22 TaxID=2939437 RepID=UPI002017AD60|nr:TlpA disulfide reductase family protein [Deinococcus sp. QL22]UQN08061.1 TlpA family protein disulfide reductase [Deinococcus sp. QL22]
MKRVLLVLALAAFGSPLSLAGGGVGPALQVAPNFTFTDLSGEQFSLTKLRGKAVIVLFGDLRCASCRENDQLLRGYQLEYLSHGLVVISLYRAATPQELQQYDAQFNFSVLTGALPSRALAEQYGASTLPTSVFIDRTGTIRGIRRGLLSEAQLLQMLQSLM